MKKFTSLLLAMALMMGAFATVSADEQDNDANTERTEKRAEFKMKMKQLNDGRKAELGENRDEMKQNRISFRNENKDVFAELDEETREALKQLHEEFQEDMAELKEDRDSDDDREDLLEDMKELADDYHEKVKELLTDYPEVLAAFEARKDVFSENTELRKQNAEVRKQYRGERAELVSKYKTSFVKRIGNKLDKIPTDKLEKIIEKIETLIEKYENNDNVSDDRKDKVIAQLIALQEMIEEKLEDENNEDILDIEEILELDEPSKATDYNSSRSNKNGSN